MTVWVLIVLAAILLVIVAGGAALALTARRDYRAANEVLPGATSGAPAEWAGAHTAEALLHRRLRDAIRALHQNPRRDDPSFLDLRVGLEQQALAVDEQLIAVAALPEGVRAGPLGSVDATVKGIEATVADLAVQASAGAPMLEQSTAELTERFRAIEAARAELVRLQPAPAVEAPADPLATNDQPGRKPADPDADSSPPSRA